MRSYPVDTDYTNALLSPFAFNAELAEMFGVFHSLDTYNFADQSITVAKLAAGACGDLLIRGTDIGQAYTVQKTAGISDVYPIPNATGTPWIETMTTGDGVLKLTLASDVRNNTDTHTPVWIGIKLDGELVARSPTHPDDAAGAADSNDVVSLFCFATVPVGAGSHVIEPCFGVYPDSVLWTAANNIEFDTRQLVAREVLR